MRPLASCGLRGVVSSCAIGNGSGEGRAPVESGRTAFGVLPPIVDELPEAEGGVRDAVDARPLPFLPVR